VLADEPRLVEADPRAHGVVDREDREELGLDGGLGERPGPVLVGDVGEDARGVLRLEPAEGLGERRLELRDDAGRGRGAGAGGLSEAGGPGAGGGEEREEQPENPGGPTGGGR